MWFLSSVIIKSTNWKPPTYNYDYERKNKIQSQSFRSDFEGRGWLKINPSLQNHFSPTWKKVRVCRTTFLPPSKSLLKVQIKRLAIWPTAVDGCNLNEQWNYYDKWDVQCMNVIPHMLQSSMKVSTWTNKQTNGLTDFRWLRIWLSSDGSYCVSWQSWHFPLNWYEMHLYSSIFIHIFALPRYPIYCTLGFLPTISFTLLSLHPWGCPEM